MHNEVASDESELLMQILPLRCRVDQRGIAFARAFFYSPTDDEEKILPPGLHTVPPPLFTTFRVRPLKLKVDYTPIKLDARALRDGSIVELVNLSPIDGMVLTLQEVKVDGEVGLSSALSVVVSRWVQYICATQLYKFVANTRPLEAFTTVSGSALDLVVLPWEAFQHGESIKKALRTGATCFTKSVAYELLTLTSRAADLLAGCSRRDSSSAFPNAFPIIPRGFIDATPHAVQSLSRGLQTANYTVVIVPFLEYQRSGAKGAFQKVLKGIPVAITAPASGMAEALSVTLRGARNQIRPDLRKEEEASVRGLQFENNY